MVNTAGGTSQTESALMLKIGWAKNAEMRVSRWFILINVLFRGLN